MNILQAWQESFYFFQPKQFNLFLLVTLKSIKDAYSLLIKYWWWLYLICIGLMIASVHTSVGHSKLLFILFALPFGVALKIVQFIMILATRPSMQRKTYSYFMHYLQERWYLIALLWLATLFRMEWIPLFPIGIVLFTLFALDSPNTMQSVGKSLFRTLVMLTYNLPLWIVIFVAIFLVNALFLLSSMLFGFIGLVTFGTVLTHLLSLLFLPVEICLITNVYIKKLHEQSNLYFPQP